jgi:release factor glutamine methyltransferase
VKSVAAGKPQTGTGRPDVRGALKEAMARLRAAEVPSHTLAAELLLMHTLGRDRAWLYAHPEETLALEAVEKYFDLIAWRAGGTPTQYLTGKQEFWGLEFEVTPAVLIPRPETEHVIEVALERIGQKKRSKPLRIADVGTGSGCLAVALARELLEAEVFATDISVATLEVARRNAARHGVSERVQFIEANLLDPFLTAWPDSSDARFDLIVSNPPYIGLGEREKLPREIREHEPAAALFGGERGVEIYAPLMDQAAKLLGSGGSLVVELGDGALGPVQELFESRPAWMRVAVTMDLTGIPRVLAADRA